MKSLFALALIATVWIWLGSAYYPKWKNVGPEATISWDVSGYYHYLPACFIYHDLRTQAFMDDINSKYLPSPAYDQSFDHPSGNKVNKYAIGQAVLFSPFFLIAHAYASITGSAPADGYSRPYQFCIWLGGLLVSILGLFLLRKILLFFFNDLVVAFVLIALALGTHWMEYAAISNGMNHTWLLTLLCILILSTIRFYKKADWPAVLGIGASLGLSILTRPTEAVWVLIPFMWNLTSLRSRVLFLRTHWMKCLASLIICFFILIIQPVYWKYASGEWIVYSYGQQSFDFLHPKIWRGLMGVNVGWWLYTPLMLISMFGWVRLFKVNRPLFWPVFITTVISVYITLSWPYWETGGGLGQRNLIQIYPLMAFPLGMLITQLWCSVFGKWIWITLLGANIYYTGWWVHQAHKGGFFQPGQMNTPYFYSIVGRLQPSNESKKLLDTDELFKGVPHHLSMIKEVDFEQDSLTCSVVAGSSRAACLNDQVQFIGPINFTIERSCGRWIRLEADITVQSREWDVWKFTQWIVQFFQGEEVIKTNQIRLQRIIVEDNKKSRVYFDVKLPGKDFDRCSVTFWNAGSSHTVLIDNLTAACFQ